METDRDSKEVVGTESKEDYSESWIEAINSTEQMIESISPPLLSLVTSDADSTIEETEAPTNKKARELSLRMSGRASRQEDEAVKQQQKQLTETLVDEKARKENKERPAAATVDSESRINAKSSTMVVTDDEAGKSKRAKCDLPIKKTGVRFGNLKPIPTDRDLDPPPFACLNCWRYNHRSDECPAPRKLHCDNCGRKGETTSTCPRCRDEHQRFICELESRRAKERAEPERQSRTSIQGSNKAKERAEQEAIYRAKVEAARKSNALEDEEKRRRAAAAQAEELRRAQEGARTGAISKIKSIVVPVIAPGVALAEQRRSWSDKILYALRSTEGFDPKLRQVIIQRLIDEEKAEKAQAEEISINGGDEEKKEDLSKKSRQDQD
ncbi:hypothetical protein TKK_0013493 [Trichogramma kaykai]|uniref:CCHC-type domain-containing protein n=1 Tax=Trichogramma kaykai TaxID=54128 RepID=A0ABD2WI57_9HYME